MMRFRSFNDLIVMASLAALDIDFTENRQDTNVDDCLNCVVIVLRPWLSNADKDTILTEESVHLHTG